MDLRPDADSRDATSEDAEGQSPRHQISVRSLMNLARHVELDVWYRYTDHLPALAIDRHSGLDVRVGWRPRSDLEFSIVGQNLLQRSHQEFEPLVLGGMPSEVERAVYFKVTVRL